MLSTLDHFIKMYSRGGGNACYTGGEEFMLLLPDTTRDDGAVIAKRLCANVARQPFTCDGDQRVKATVSIGVACLDGERSYLPTPGMWLFQQADAALYTAKQAGRNRVFAVLLVLSSSLRGHDRAAAVAGR